MTIVNSSKNIADKYNIYRKIEILEAYQYDLPLLLDINVHQQANFDELLRIFSSKLHLLE